jgi:hypothetical protein
MLTPGRVGKGVAWCISGKMVWRLHLRVTGHADVNRVDADGRTVLHVAACVVLKQFLRSAFLEKLFALILIRLANWL